MAVAKWVNLGIKFCDFVDEEVELLEKRVYPTGFLNVGNARYRVLMRKCSAGYQCSHMEDPCQWAEVEGDGRLYNE